MEPSKPTPSREQPEQTPGSLFEVCWNLAMWGGGYFAYGVLVGMVSLFFAVLRHWPWYALGGVILFHHEFYSCIKQRYESWRHFAKVYLELAVMVAGYVLGSFFIWLMLERHCPIHVVG